MTSFLFSGTDHDLRRLRDSILLLRSKIRTQMLAGAPDVQGLRDEMRGTIEAEASLDRLVEWVKGKEASHVG